MGLIKVDRERKCPESIIEAKEYLDDGKVEKCYAKGSVNGKNVVGGLVGLQQSNTTISKCYSAGSVISSASNVGGLVGTQSGYINNSFSTASVKGVNNVGGLVGNCKNIIIDAYALGKTMQTGTGAYIGGLKGLGNNKTVSNSYWCPETTLQISSYGSTEEIKGTSLTLEQLSHQENYNNWDFDDTWTIEEGETTAYLQELDKPLAIKADGSDITVPETAIITEKTDSKTLCRTVGKV